MPFTHRRTLILISVNLLMPADKNGAQPEPSDLHMVMARNDSLGPDPALPASLALLYLLEAHQLWWGRGGCHSLTTVPTALSQTALHTGISSLASLPPPPAASWNLLETAGCHSFWDFRMIDSCLE